LIDATLPPKDEQSSRPILKQIDILHSTLESITPKSDQGQIVPCLQLKRLPPPSLPSLIGLCGWVGVHLPLATGESDIHESAGVCDTLLRATLGGLLLLLRLNLWCLRLDLSGTSEGSVDLSHDCGLSVCI